MAEVGIRSYLNGKGFKDDEITYNNGNIMLKGKQFYNATPKADGSTYGDMNQLNQAYNSYNMNDAMDTWKSNMSKPRQEFNFDPNTNQNYQNALQAAGRSAQTAGNNATVALGSRGIGNSQQAMTTQNQIQQRAVADVNSNLLPQFQQQAYNQFHDKQVMDDNNNDKLLNYASTLNGLNQQSFNNDRLTQADERQRQQDHINLANQLSNTYGIKVDPKDDPSLAYSQVAGLTPLAMREYNDRRNDTKFEQDYKTNSFNHSKDVDGRQLDISQQNADVNSANSNWNMSKDNPDNIYKSQEIEKVKAEMAQIGKNKPITTENAIDILNKSSFVVKDSDTGTTKVDKNGMIQAIAGMGVPDAQMDALFNYYGISQKDIQAIEGQLRGN